MAKKTHNISKIIPENKVEEKTNFGSYEGAEWTGPDGLNSPEFGILSKGQIYSIDESRAKNSNDWRPIYKSKN